MSCEFGAVQDAEEVQVPSDVSGVAGHSDLSSCSQRL